jgi:hypothetical protein
MTTMAMRRMKTNEMISQVGFQDDILLLVLVDILVDLLVSL